MKARNGQALARLDQPLPGTVPDPRYPDSDGKPLGETDFHIAAIFFLREALQYFFARQADVYVASDMFWYWEYGNWQAKKAPDTMVIKGVGKHFRRSFRSWEENHARPCVIFEMVSEDSFMEDTVEKHQLYARLGVKEYFLFDPEGASPIDPVFQGFRLRRGRYTSIPAADDGSLTSTELGLRLAPEGAMLRLRDARTGRRILTHQERAEQAERRRRRAQQRADDLAAEVARLRALLNLPEES